MCDIVILICDSERQEIIDCVQSISFRGLILKFFIGESETDSLFETC